MSHDESQARPEETVPAGVLPPWTVGDLPKPPSLGWRSWAALIGPGVLMAGSSVGSGEWLAGPGVTAQYGGTLLWIATLSIAAQVFCNLEFMRYTMYCGEPILVGAFRTKPGPKLWTWFYAMLDFAQIWPFNVAGAAGAVAAIVLGHLARGEDEALVHGLGCALFVLAYVPLFFGGTVYKTLEWIMTVKLVIVLVFLSLVTIFLVSSTSISEVMTGFFRFGQIPLRASTIIDGRHFTLTETAGGLTYVIRGTVEEDKTVITEFRAGDQVYGIDSQIAAEHTARHDEMRGRAENLSQPGTFFFSQEEDGITLSAAGSVASGNSTWQLERVTIRDDEGPKVYEDLDAIPQVALRDQVRELTQNRGVRRVNLIRYTREEGRLPNLDWAMIATFASIAGAGGLTNSLLSNYARDKGWGMGARVGAIPSAVGGRTLALSHVGQVFRPTPENRTRWRGWMRHIIRDQAVVWFLACFVGMALPCMISVEFIRNAPVSGLRVAGMTAEGIDHEYPGYGLWIVMLLISFLVLYPGQIMQGDTVPRRWCDIIWTASAHARRLGERQVKQLYYGLMAIIGVFGFLVLLFMDPLSILKVGGVLMNVALGASSLHALFVNCTFLPPEVRPNWFIRAGVLFCSMFFFAISGVVFISLL